MDLFMCCLKKVTYNPFYNVHMQISKNIQRITSIIKLWVRYQIEEGNVSQLSFSYNGKSSLYQ